MMEPVLLEVTTGDLESLATGMNLMWALTVTFLIFFMHAGFAMLEAGQVRSKNVANQLTKNMLTWAVGIFVFFVIGMGISNNVGSALVGGDSTPLTMFGEGSFDWVMWLFSAVFAMTAATIVSGAVAGRAKLRAYVTYTFLLAAVIYPVVAGMVWYAPGAAEGVDPILAGFGFSDFAGGMVVHGVGGVAGLTAAWILGARMDKYNDDGSSNVIPGHSMTFAVLGTLVLCFGWFGFNVGTAATVIDAGTFELADFDYVGSVAMVTALGMGLGAVGASAVSIAINGKVDTLYVANGMLAGLVGVTGPTDLLTPMGAIAIGFIAGAQLPIVFRFVERKLKIDDVCAVFPVHGSAGMLGLILYPLWSNGATGREVTTVGEGLIAGGIVSIEAGAFVPQVVGVAVITIWTVAATAAVWGALKAIGEARVTPEHERDGLDVTEHGVDTYPEFGDPTIATDGGPAVSDDRLRTDGGEPAESVRSSSDLRSDGGVSDYSTDVQMITAIIRPDRLGAVKQALAEVGAPSLTVTNVSGRGSQPAKKGQWRGEEYTVDLHQKTKLECVVADIDADEVVEAIREAANTGEPGDGKIFVLPVEGACQVRTGETGTDAV